MPVTTLLPAAGERQATRSLAARDDYRLTVRAAAG
jgi:hypothetical protein